ncbi:MAG: hypothetical protein M3328_06260, partial [Chloroflexota bacterium]|nr:hypothetical protein [Chloroflexota bacterium]
MSRRLAYPTLILLLGLVLVGLLALSSAYSAQAAAPPGLQPGNSGPTTQQPASVPSGAGGAWEIVAQLPNTRVHLPEPQASLVQPARLKRAGAVMYPPNGKIYLLGGRMGIDGEDNPTSNNGNGNNNFSSIGPSMPPYAWLFEYTPAPDSSGMGTWVRKSADIDLCGT